MLEKQVAELLATYLSRFIEDVTAEQLEISLWSGNVVLNNVHLRANVLERITALLHGEAGSADGVGEAAPAAASNGSSGGLDAGAATQSAASVRMLLAPFTVVHGIVRNLTIRVPWSSLESVPIHVQVSGVELVLGPLRARPFNAWEEQEREEAIKQQQLTRYEAERQRMSRGLASEFGSRSSSTRSKNGRTATSDDDDSAAEVSSGSWFSWIWDFDRISQIAVRNVCVTMHDVCMRYEFDYEGLHPELATAFAIFVRELRLTTANQRFREAFVSDLLSPLCKQILLSDIVVSTHAMRLSEKQKSNSCNSPDNIAQRASSTIPCRDDDDASPSASSPTFEDTSSSPLSTPATGRPSAYDVYQAQWSYSKAVISIAKLELAAKMVPPNCTSRNSIVEDAVPLSTSSTELTVSAAEGVHVDVCFGVVQALESMWRSYHRSLGCARYRKRLHLLRVSRRHASLSLRSPSQPEAPEEKMIELDRSKASESSPLLHDVLPLCSARQQARRRWQFALRCVLDDVQQKRQTFNQHDRNRREVIEGIMKFCQLRRTYCQYWKRTQGVPWAPPLDALEEKKLKLMERQLSLTQVIFLRCLSYAEMVQEEDGLARQRAFIDEARQRNQKGTVSAQRQQERRKQTSEKGRTGGLWGWLAKAASPLALDSESYESEVAVEVLSDPCTLAVPLSVHTPAIADLLAAEWEVGRRYTAPHHAPLAQPSVPQSLLPAVTQDNPTYFTLRCLVDVLTVQFDPVYWPLLHDSSVPSPPLDTPLRRIQQQLCTRLSVIEVFYTTVPDERPDKASYSFFVGSAVVSFEGVLRSVLLQSKEAAGEDFLVVKQNACRTHASVWVAPQLVICQPLHEWRWWGVEVGAFVEWFRAVQQAFYSPEPPTRGVAAAGMSSSRFGEEATLLGSQVSSRGGRVTRSSTESITPNLRRSPRPQSIHQVLALSNETSLHLPSAPKAPPLVWNITVQSTDICIPLTARDITDADLEIVDHQPSGLSSLVLVDSVATALPLKGASHDHGTRRTLSADDVHPDTGADQEGKLSSAARTTEVRRRAGLRAFLYDDTLDSHDEDDDGEGNAGSFPASVGGSFASATPERCFLSNDACLVLSISTTRLVTVAASRRRYQGEENEYHLCIGDPDKAVRLFCQKGLFPETLASNQHLELMSFAAGEVLLNPRELCVVFNKGIDVVVEPDAFATLNDGLLKPAVFTCTDSDAQLVQSLAGELRDLDVSLCNEGGLGEVHGRSPALRTHNGRVPLPSWRLCSPGCVEILAGASGGEATTVVPHTVRHFPADCARHILRAALPVARNDTNRSQDGETVECEPQSGLTESSVLGGRTIALGVSVARLLVRSLCNEDTAEVVLIAPEEVPVSTVPYRGMLAALGVHEPRAIELVWNPSLQHTHVVQTDVLGGAPIPLLQGKAEGDPFFLLSVPDITMTTAAGQKLCTVEQLTVVQKNAEAASRAATRIAVSVEDASMYFDLVLVDLLEAVVGTLCALQPMNVSPAPMPGEEGVADMTSSLAPTLSLEVRSLHLQAPLTKSDADGAPYAEVNARLSDLCLSIERHAPGETSRRVRVGFELSQVDQLVDFTGADPETRNLVTALPWTLHAGERDDVQPLLFKAEIAVPDSCRGLSDDGDGAAGSSSLPTTACHVVVTGGAIHAYFPFLYLLADVVAKDERIRRLKRLSTSPLFNRGFTFLSHELLLGKGGEVGSGSAFGTPTTFAPTPAVSAPPTRQLEFTVVLCDLDIFLAADAAVPIDVGNPDTMCVLHVAEVRAGFMQTASSAVGGAIPMQLRTRAYLDTVSLYLLDLIAPEPNHVRLPNVKVRAEGGVLLVPKESLTGYRYERANEEDMTVLVGAHPPAPLTDTVQGAAAETTEQEPIGGSAAAPMSEASKSAAAAVSVDLDVYQCRSLIRFVARNVAQPPVASAQDGRVWDLYEEAAHSLRSRKKYASSKRYSTANLTEDSGELKGASAPTSAALTFLVTLPPASLVLRADALAPAPYESCSSNSAAAHTHDVAYEFALRRGAQFYAASGGQWSHSPMKNGQLSGLELNARSGSSATFSATSSFESSPVQSLFTADLVGIALVEGKSPAVDHSNKDDDGGAAPASTVPVTRVAAAVRHATFRIPHVQWWLRLYMLFADSAAEMTLSGSAPRSVSPATYLMPESLAGTDGSLLYRVNGSSRQSSVLFSPRVANRVASRGLAAVDRPSSGNPGSSLTSSQGSRWVHGTVELSQVQVTLGDVQDVDAVQQPRQSHPWCRLLISEARLTVSPVALPQSGGASRVYDEVTFDIPKCPQLLLRAGPADAESASQPSKVVYVSVLKLQPSTPAPLTDSTSTSAGGSCVKVRLIRSPHAHLISTLRYGRSYHMTDLTLHRTCAVQVELSGMLLNVPARELFGLAHELLRQSSEVHALLTPADDALRPSTLRSAGPARTYTGFEAQLTNVGVIVSSESPHAVATGAPAGGSSAESPWCGVTVASLRLTTDVELENVLTNTCEPATLMDDALAVGWQMRVWHLVSNVALHGVVLAGHYAADARWRLPGVDLAVSQPLSRTVLCVRANRDTGVSEDETSFADSEPPSVVHRQRSCTDFFHVEPTSADVCSELNSHFLTRASVEVGEVAQRKDDGADTSKDRAKGADSAPPVVVSLSTAYTLCRSVMHLLHLWKELEVQTEASSQTDVEDASEQQSRLNVGSSATQPTFFPGPIVWYELNVSLRGHRVHFVSDAPEDAAHCVMELTMEDMLTVQVDRELVEAAVDYATPRFGRVRSADNVDDDKESARGTHANAAALHTRHRARFGRLRVSDGAGNLIALLSSEGKGTTEERHALTIEYTASANAVSAVVGHALIAASPISTAFAVQWLRAWEAWAFLWAKPVTLTFKDPQSESQAFAAPRNASWSFLQVSVLVHQTEVLLAPAGFLVLKRLQLSQSLQGRECRSPEMAAPAEVLWQAQYDELSLHSTSAVQCRSSVQTRKPELLATVRSLLLRYTFGMGGSAATCHVPSVVLVNRDRHSWGLCTARAALFVKSAVALWTSTRVVTGALSTLRDASGELNSAGQSTDSSTRFTAWFSGSYQLIVDKAEVLCFAAEDETSSASPALQICAERVEMALPSADVAPLKALETHAHATAVMSASYRSAGSSLAPMLPFLEGVAVTVSMSAIAEHSSAASEMGKVTVRLQVADPGVRLHVPTSRTLEFVVAALSMVATQHVPHRQSERRARRAPPTTIGYPIANGHASSCGAGKTERVWCLSFDIPGVSCDLAAEGSEETLQRLAAFDVREIQGVLEASSSGQRPQLEVRVREVSGFTDVSETPVKDLAPALFLSAKPLSRAQTQPSARTSDRRIAVGAVDQVSGPPADTQQFAFFLQQKSLLLSHDDTGSRDSTPRCQNDGVTTLTVRLHALHTHATLAFVRAFTMEVLRPVVRGLKSAASTVADESVMSTLHSKILHVSHPRTALPPMEALERHAALVRQVEVTSDWIVTHDLVLGGGTGGSCSLQLHFRNTTPRSVITVRGETKRASDIVTIHLSCCERVNGDLGPAICVDSDLTVKFENVRFVVDNRDGHSTAPPDAFVMLGERALCVFPPSSIPPPPSLPTLMPIAPTPAALQAESLSSTPGGTSWPAMSIYSVDAKMGFDMSLSSGLRCLKAAGTWQLRYRFEASRKRQQAVRTEREGEVALTLQACTNECGPLTHTPVAFVARLSDDNDLQTRVKVTVDLGSTEWCVPLGHLRLLVTAVESVMDAVSHEQAPMQQDRTSSLVWTPPTSFTAHRLATGDNQPCSPVPLDLECELPLCRLCVTDDLQRPLVMGNVERFRLTCASDTHFTDAVVGAAASLYVTDRLGPAHHTSEKEHSAPLRDELAPAPQQGRTAPTGAVRVLLAAKPSLTLAWTRFSADSRSLSLSINVEDVVITLPATTALRAFRRVRMTVDGGVRAFENDCGIDLTVVAASASADQDVRADADFTTWPLETVPSRGGVVTTGIPLAVSKLLVAPQCSAATSPPLHDKALARSPASLLRAPLPVALDLQTLESDTVCRIRLPGYVSSLGALDLVVRQSVKDGVDVVHFATSVQLTNAFFSPCNANSHAATVILPSSTDSGLPAFAVAPRSTRYVPLSILKDRFAVALDGCTYAPQAQLLTWAMLADAMTLMEDQMAANDSGRGASLFGSSSSVGETLRRLSADAERTESGGDKRGALCGQAHMEDASTVTFPVLLQCAVQTSTSTSPTTAASLTKDCAEVDSSAPPSASPSSPRKTPGAQDAASPSRVVQFTWRRRRSRLPSQLLFSGQLPPCEYTVTVQPVWTLWNCSGCRLRLHLRRPRRENVGKAGTSRNTTAIADGNAEDKRSSPQAGVADTADKKSKVEEVIASAVVDSGACFQWTPTSLEVLSANITVVFQIESPFSSPPQWWSAAAALSLQENPPPYIRLQQSSGSQPRGAVSIERHGSATVVVRCAALLRSTLSQPVYLRDASHPLPVLGTDTQGCLHPQQVLPLFFSENVTTPTPNAERVGFAVYDKPLRGNVINEKEGTDPYILTSPIAATVLSADEREDCTVFYVVSADNAGNVEPAVAVSSAAQDPTLWSPIPPAKVQLRSLCSIQNADTVRTLFVRPYVRDGDAPEATLAALGIETVIPPGETRVIHQFSARADEPEVHFCYSGAEGRTHAHLWSPPVRLLSLATSTVPLVLKHTCAPTAAFSSETHTDAFRLSPAPRSAEETTAPPAVQCRCLSLQSSTAGGRLCVVARLQSAPPLYIVNRLNTTLEFCQMLTCSMGSTPASSSVGSVSKNVVCTALCSHTSLPRSYIVTPETSCYGCWEVPTLEFQGLRITLHSNRRKGYTACVDVDVLKCAATPSSGLRVGQTDAYVYVSLNHLTHQYTVTVVPTRQLECRMLFQPRRVTQLEVFVPSCSIYLAAVTLPTTGSLSRASVVARDARGRLRRAPGFGGSTGMVVPIAATDEDIVAVLRQLEIDVLCMRIAGAYGSATMTERHALGSASVGIVEVLDCTTPEAVYPVVFRMSSNAAGRSVGRMTSSGETATEKNAAATTSCVGERNDTAQTSSSLSDAGAGGAASVAAGVPRFKDPSWCNVEVQLTRSDMRAGGSVMVPLQLLRISVPPVSVHLHDELLFTVRTSVESVLEELRSEPSAAQPSRHESLRRTLPLRIDASAEPRASARPQGSPARVYNIFLYELQVSAIATEVTYTRSGDRRCNPFRNLDGVPAHLLPSMEGLIINLKAVRLTNVELLSVTSLANIVTSFVWPLYRTQLLLQSYKIVGSLDVLGNPRALLGSWSRGVWDLVTNASGRSRWAGTRDFLRTTTSSTLHSVGVLARSIGNLTSVSGDSDVTVPHSIAGSQGRGVLSEVFAGVRGGVTDAVTKPFRGAREGGVNGFFVGVASGVVGLVGRPMFGFFRGVGVTSEFYARLLGGQTTLSDEEARRMALERNYQSHQMETAPEGASVSTLAVAAARQGEAMLTCSVLEEMMADIPRWRLSEEANARAAVARVGVHNAALFAPYPAISASFTPEEFAEALPTALTALLSARLVHAVTHRSARASLPAKRSDADVDCDGDGDAQRTSTALRRLARECERATHIKASLGVSALQRYVSGDIFVRVCSLTDMSGSVAAADLHANYVILLAKAVNSVGDELFVP